MNVSILLDPPVIYFIGHPCKSVSIPLDPPVRVFHRTPLQECIYSLAGLVGDAERPELRRHIDDLDHAWENITAMYARREQNLADALEKAMEFHETLQVRRRSGPSLK